MHFPAFLFVLAVLVVPLLACTANPTAHQAFDAMSRSGYGHGSGYQNGGVNYDMNTAMDTADEGFTPTSFSTKNDGDDYATSGQSNTFLEAGTYQEAPPLSAEYELLDSHDEGPLQAPGSYETTHDSMDTTSFTVIQFLARQESWNQVAPSRENTLPKDPQEWENLFGDKTFDLQPQDCSNNATHGDNSAAPMDRSFAPQDFTDPNFTGDTYAAEAVLEPVPGLQAQPGGRLHYPFQLDFGSEAINPSFTLTQGQSTTATTATTAGPPFKCEGCAKLWETKTQLKRCIARHVKPHLCPVIGCEKNEDGFATSNDADRHCDSVHQQDLVGNPRPPRPCLGRDCQKTFPQTRNDNHKQHLKKVHGMSDHSADNLLAGLSPSGRIKHHQSYRSAEPHDIENYSAPHVKQGVDIALSSGVEDPKSQSQSCEVGNHGYEYQSQTMHASTDYARYQGVPLSQASLMPAGLVDPLLRNNNNSQPRMDLPINSRTQFTNSFPSSSQGGAKKSSLEDTAVTSAFFSMPSPREKMNTQLSCQKPTGDPRSPAQELIQGVLGDIRSQKSKSFSRQTSTYDISSRPSLKSYQTAPESLHPSSPDSSKGFGQTRDEVKAARIVQALEAKYDLVEKGSNCATDAPPNMSSPAADTANHDSQNCNTCYKHRDSPCRLKKHLERKAQLYPCIHNRCEERFGSKNDQMRHDNSKHVNFEKWRCRLMRDGARCGSEFNHSASFENHLTRDHRLRATDAKGLVGKGRIINENYPDEFWCGFCGYRLRCIGDAKTRRDLFFTHVEDHLKARNGEQTAKAHHWRSMPLGVPLPIELILRRKQTTNQASSSSTSANRVESQMPAQSRHTSFRATATARPQPFQAPSSSDASNKRHPSKSPLLQPQGGGKRLKSDDELRHMSNGSGNSWTRSRKITTVTINCCSCSSFGNEMTGWCDCGHEYGSCCGKQYVRQLEQEFDARIGDYQGRGGYGRGQGNSSYVPSDSRSIC